MDVQGDGAAELREEVREVLLRLNRRGDGLAGLGRGGAELSVRVACPSPPRQKLL